MIKSLSLLAFAGTIGASGMADHLKSSTAIPPSAAPPVLEERHHGQEGRLGSAAVKTLACFILKTSSNLAIHQKTLYFLTWVKSIGR